MTFQETLDFLYQQLPVFHREGSSAYKKDLTRTLALLNHFDNPHEKLTCIHVAGTNGKGSTSHFLSSILQEAGYKTGLYTSPHVKHFGERIKINGKFIQERFVIDFVEEVRPLLPIIQPSFFELTVVLAYQYFLENECELCVIETGLGGRLDSTNVINPAVSLITNISYDHMDLLGPTLEAIASEKAGIIKPNVPVVVSEKQTEVNHVFETFAKSNNSPLTFASDHLQVGSWRVKNQFLEVSIRQDKEEYGQFLLGLTGKYQLKNILGVLQTIEVLVGKGLKVPAEAVKEGLKNVQKNTSLKGRWQVLSTDPLVVCDIAHNAGGIQSVLETAAAYQPKTLRIVLGMVKDKDISKVLESLPTTATYYFTQAHLPRALAANELRAAAQAFGLEGDHYDDVNVAVRQALIQADKKDLILVCGSNFVVAELEGV